MKLSKEDELLIDIVVEGTSELINAIIGRDAKKDATFSSYEESKSLATTYMNSITEINQFRPAEIRKSFPDKIRDIASADLTRTLGSSIRVQRMPYSMENQSQRKRGHPTTYDSIDPSIPGPKSRYKISNFESKLNRLFSEAEAVQLIYHRLCESKLLLQLEYYVQMWMYHNMRSYDLDRAWERCRSVFLLPRREFDRAYTEIGNMNEENLKARALMIAKKNLKLRSPERFIGLFRIGAIAFHSRIKSS